MRTKKHRDLNVKSKPMLFKNKNIVFLKTIYAYFIYLYFNAFVWLKYCLYGLKEYPINKLINLYFKVYLLIDVETSLHESLTSKEDQTHTVFRIFFGKLIKY